MLHKTLQVYVKGEEMDSFSSVFEEIEKFSETMRLSRKNSLYARLITEELLGMFSGITSKDFKALFWAEGEDNKAVFHLVAKTEMTAEKKKQLLEAASSKKNDAAVGIMGKIKDMIQNAVLNMGVIPGNEFYDAGVLENGPIDGLNLFWTLDNYRRTMEQLQTQEEDKNPAWDELERSIIANVANDVHVSIKNDAVQIDVFKNM